MKKIGLIICLIFTFTTFCFANEVSAEQSAESQLEGVVNEARDNVPQRRGQDRDAAVSQNGNSKQYYKTYQTRSERKVVNNLAMIIASTPLITFGGWFFGFSGYLFSQPDSMATFAGAPACIATGLALFTAGMALLLVGAVHLPRSIDNSENAELSRRLQKMNRALENLAIVSGVFSATGLASLGMGIGFMCYGNDIKGRNIDTYDVKAESIFGTGVALTTIGTIFTFSFLPIFISSLSVFCTNKLKIDSISPEVAITHDDRKGLNEGYGVSMGMRIRI